MKVIGNGTLITLNDKDEVIENGAVVVENDEIIFAGKESEAQNLMDRGQFEYIDANKGIIMPGMINVHHHLYSTFARGMALKDEAPENFVQILERLWWKLDKALLLDDIYYSAIFPLISCLRAGTTTIIDHHASPYKVKGSLNKITEALEIFGIRGCLCYEVSDRDGDEIRDLGLEENYNFIKRCKEENNPKLAALLGLHASMTLSDETLAKAKEIIEELNTGVHIHAAEDKADVEDSLSKYNLRVIERLEKAGLLNEKSITAHCIHINEKEQEILRDKKVNAVHNPQSNMNNAVGCADVLGMLSKNVLMGLGTDGMTSNMFEEVRVAHLLHKHQKHDPRVAFVEAATLLLKNNAKIASKYFNKKLGVLEKGAFADVITFRYYPPTPLNDSNVLGHMYFGFAGLAPENVMIGGELRLKGWKYNFDFDEIHVSESAKKHAKALWERF